MHRLCRLPLSRGGRERSAGGDSVGMRSGEVVVVCDPGGDGDGHGSGDGSGDGGDDPGRRGNHCGATRNSCHKESSSIDSAMLKEMFMISRLPPLIPENFYWDGEPALLRQMIQTWKKNLAGYSDQMALNFLERCVPRHKQHVIDTSDTLEQCLAKFGTYTANEELYLRKLVGQMRSSLRSRNHHQDMILLTMFETNIVQIARLNAAYSLDYGTAQQMISKLSDFTLKNQYIWMN